mmetsp:Transcript_8732/g.14141  ORF Transcript_8732/g.14141 Transcript_8732/m.14141 type:complete len:230 (-) Transcript_8732:52-741(-)
MHQHVRPTCRTHPPHAFVPCTILYLFQTWMQAPLWFQAFCVKPEENFSKFLAFICVIILNVYPLGTGHIFGTIRNVLVFTILVKLPEMIRTNNVIPLDFPTMAKVRAKVRTKCINHPDLSIIPSKNHKLSRKRRYCQHVAFADLLGVPNSIPAVRKRLWKVSSLGTYPVELPPTVALGLEPSGLVAVASVYFRACQVPFHHHHHQYYQSHTGAHLPCPLPIYVRGRPVL